MNFLKVLEPRKIEFLRKCSRILCVRSTPDWLAKLTTESITLTADEVRERQTDISDMVKLKWGILIEPCFTLLELLIRDSAQFAVFCVLGKETDIERN